MISHYTLTIPGRGDIAVDFDFETDRPVSVCVRLADDDEAFALGAIEEIVSLAIDETIEIDGWTVDPDDDELYVGIVAPPRELLTLVEGGWVTPSGAVTLDPLEADSYRPSTPDAATWAPPARGSK